MRVDIIINEKAGHSNQNLIERQVREALYRCELFFHIPSTITELHTVIYNSLKANTSFFIICGGDGTLNVALQPMMQLRASVEYFPPVLMVPVGTANDLATQLGISRHIDRAARAIFEGGIKIIDILEIKAAGKTCYMITNGGLGIAAQTARKANIIRRWIKKRTNTANQPSYLKYFAQFGMHFVERAGSKIYDLLLINDVTQWDHRHWEAEIEVPGKTKFTTKAPFILINNQPTIGGKFTPAPFTSNTDGTFNILLIEPTQLLPQVKTLLDIRFGRIPSFKKCPSLETREIHIRATDHSRPLTFFGDGEILHKRVRELSIRCIHPGLPIVTMGCP